MPRGNQTIEIITPVSGARFDLPPHKLQPDMLAVGSFNVLCDATSVLRPRNGYATIGTGAGPQRPLTGGIAWEGTNGNIYIVLADTEAWWTYTAATNQWTPLGGSNAPVLPDDFTQFAVFNVSGTDYLFAVNNNQPMLQWIVGGADITGLVGLPFDSALDIFVLANRLVVVNTLEAGVRYPNRVRWSQVNNPFVFPAQAVADLADPGGRITAGLRMGNLQAFIYLTGTEGTGALQTMTAQAGDDANAFSFSEFSLGEGVVPPASAAAITAVGGYHYFIGQDGHLWQFDGVSPSNLGIPIQSDLYSNVNRPFLNHSFVVYVPLERHIWFFYPSGTASYPNRAAYYSLDFQRWEAPAEFTEQFRCGFSGPLSFANEQIAFIGSLYGGIFALEGGTTDAGAPIPFTAIWGLRNTTPLAEMQINFAEAFLVQASEADVMSLTINGLRTPGDLAQGGVTFLMQLTQSNQFQQLSTPGINRAGSLFWNWLQIELSGVTQAGTLHCYGAYIDVHVRDKGVYPVHGRGPE